jgi:hypothetical protein
MQKLSKKSRLKILGIKIISSTPLVSKLAHKDIRHIATFLCAQTVDKSLASISIFLLASNLRPCSPTLFYRQKGFATFVLEMSFVLIRLNMEV